MLANWARPRLLTGTDIARATHTESPHADTRGTMTAGAVSLTLTGLLGGSGAAQLVVNRRGGNVVAGDPTNGALVVDLVPTS